MKIVAVICNIVLFGFLCFVLVTDGFPTETSYIVFTVWALLTPILNTVVISRSSLRNIMKKVAVVFNVVLLGLICWAFVGQYPHPKEAGFVPFLVMMVLTPILSLGALLCCRTGEK